MNIHLKQYFIWQMGRLNVIYAKTLGIWKAGMTWIHQTDKLSVRAQKAENYIVKICADHNLSTFWSIPDNNIRIGKDIYISD